jgi:hypothetical protein
MHGNFMKIEEPYGLPSSAEISSARADVAISRFLLSSPGARLAAASLRSGAEVAITFTNLPGDWRILNNDAGELAFEPIKATDPDFELRIPPRAAESICSQVDADVGDLGIAFFELVNAREQELKIQVTVHSGLIKLTRRGWLGVVAKGGSKVMGWMAQKGLRGPGAIATALGKLKR